MSKDSDLAKAILSPAAYLEYQCNLADGAVQRLIAPDSAAYALARQIQDAARSHLESMRLVQPLKLYPEPDGSYDVVVTTAPSLTPDEEADEPEEKDHLKPKHSHFEATEHHALHFRHSRYQEGPPKRF